MSLLKTNPTAFWGLIISAIVVVIIGFGIWVTLFLKVKKIQKRVKADKIKTVKEFHLTSTQVKLLYKIRSEFNGELDLATIEYIISTISTNKYKTILIDGQNDGMLASILSFVLKLEVTLLKEEIKDLKKLNYFIKKYKINKLKISSKLTINDKFDFCFMEEENELNRRFDNVWAKINKKGLVVLTNCKKLKRSHKDLVRYLKLIDARYEHWKINEGFIFIAK